MHGTRFWGGNDKRGREVPVGQLAEKDEAAALTGDRDDSGTEGYSSSATSAAASTGAGTGSSTRGRCTAGCPGSGEGQRRHEPDRLGGETQGRLPQQRWPAMGRAAGCPASASDVGFRSRLTRIAPEGRPGVV